MCCCYWPLAAIICGQLLHFFGISKPLLSFHEHNQKQRIPALLDALGAGEALALVSDAGLPGISDPGEALVAAARAAGHRVVCIPGPCAATTALVSSGLPSGRFCFEGFLPLKGRERKSRLEAISQESRTTVLYEAPHRLVRLLQELVEHCGPERPVQVARELTKRHEEQVGPDLAGALAHFLASAPQGECTLVLGGAATEATVLAWDETQLRQELTALVASGLTASEAAKELAQSSGLQRRALYGLLNRAN
ncbi:MAG: 16S rRNA (cytidine(1402)-2'-O)-methyltransferase [Synechococcaceae bacterium WBA_2_066]|nr:16S rRNA (cytidine(1402)-2'-O)-methyltransferase [Synechococcaceae bacterium WBA_2_066]